MGSTSGSVPRLRGDDPHLAVMSDRLWGVFPAYAGMIRLTFPGNGILLRVPRLRGDDPITDKVIASAAECSPPTRG